MMKGGEDDEREGTEGECMEIKMPRWKTINIEGMGKKMQLGRERASNRRRKILRWCE